MPFFTIPLRALAGLLRASAGLLDQLAGGQQQTEQRVAPPQPEVSRPSAARRRSPAAARETPRRRAATKRPDRDPNVPKGHIDVNVVGGVAWLRGEVKSPADIKRLGEQAQAIPEVKRVENLLHLPKTPAPTRSDTPARQRKPAGRRTKPHSPEVHLTPERITAETPTPGAEPSPTELASRREGRRAAPLGSTNGGGGESA
jgi:BON domain